MKTVSPDFAPIDPFPVIPEQHLGWVWLVKMREGEEEAEDAWLTENPREAIAKAQAMYPDARLVSCHRRDEWTTWSMFRQLMDGRVLSI